MAASRFKIFIERTLLVLAGPTLMLLLGEFGLRCWEHYQRTDRRSVEEQLAESKQLPVEQIGSGMTMAGLVQPSSHPDVVYELKPQMEGVFLGKQLRTNSAGMREREVSLAKPEGVLRIAGIGDSVMFGWGVEAHETYLRIIEEELNTQTGGPRFETLNFAVPGYNSAMEVATFEAKALAFSPDAVVIHFVANDYGVPLFMERPVYPWSWKRSALYERFERLMHKAKGLKDRAPLVPEANLTQLGGVKKQRVLSQYRHMVGEDGFRRAMKKLADLTAPRNIPVIFLVGSAKGRMFRRIKKVCKEKGFHLVQVGPYVERYIAANHPGATKEEREALLFVSPTDSHPNPLAHSLYAAALIDAVTQLNLPGRHE